MRRLLASLALLVCLAALCAGAGLILTTLWGWA